MAPPFSSSDYDTIFSLIINSSNIINGTITGADIANGTITDANIAVGTITEAKLSSALQTKLSDFDTRLTALESAPPPPPPNTGWYGKLFIVNTIISGGGRGFTFSSTTANGTINVIQQYVAAGTTYEIEVLIINRLPVNATISFDIEYFDNDATGYDAAYINGTTYTGTLYSSATLDTPAPGNNITITIPVDNDS
jgi:hypothetical protein